MKIMTETDKKQTNGGIAPMMLWVIIMGVTTLISTATHTATSIMDAKRPNVTEQRKKNSRYYPSRQNNGYIRMSAFPSRSAMTMPL